MYVCEWFILFGMMSLRVTHVVACVRISVPFKLNNIPFTSLVAQIVKNLPAKCRRPRFYPWVGKIPWRRAWQPTPVFLPGESLGQRSLGSQSLGSQIIGHD